MTSRNHPLDVPSGLMNGVRARHDERTAARRSRDDADIRRADVALREAVLEAIDAGATWSAVGDVLDMARGNTYQYFRRRPCSRNEEPQCRTRVHRVAV